MARLGRAQPYKPSRPIVTGVPRFVLYPPPPTTTALSGVAAGTGAAPHYRFIFRADAVGSAYGVVAVTAVTVQCGAAAGTGVAQQASAQTPSSILWVSTETLIWISGETLDWVS